ncbi:UNKNOWN [Stylonychia lemnae]|uniref:Transmembrane protein n=1 Tax=Stylonychia lemnae TaxID=5949 RepID=A0A078B530_STYLE|nr:UNKNOWN [Stylonychia lemnae]|eukprot:CDW89630.1 UNKNOWN [Stylonychia lemnae]
MTTKTAKKDWKHKYLAKNCCFGFRIEDGILGIVIWDSLYALFVITTSASTLSYFAEREHASQAFTDVASAAFLVVRAIVGIITLCKNIQQVHLKKYLIVRIVWDITLLILNGVMAGLKKMPFQTFIFNSFALFFLDGYFNFIIYSFYKKYNVYKHRLYGNIKNNIKNGEVLKMNVQDFSTIKVIDIKLDKGDDLKYDQLRSSDLMSPQIIGGASQNNHHQPNNIDGNFMNQNNDVNNLNTSNYENNNEFDEDQTRVQQFQQDLFNEKQQDKDMSAMGFLDKNQSIDGSIMINYSKKKQQLNKPIRKGKKIVNQQMPLQKNQVQQLDKKANYLAQQ